MDIVVTTIFPPSEGTRALSAGLESLGGGNLWIIGDRKGPESYGLPRAQFFPIARQRELDFQLARRLPEGSYARKNLGYLLAMHHGAECLVETDDDNIPLPGFWEPRTATVSARKAVEPGWRNVYRDFSGLRIWPRGFPLECLQASWQTGSLAGGEESVDALIQQGLANENPDVDAVYRLIQDLPVDFDDRPAVSLERGCWCPFNSQNTTFFKEAFPLLYLPVHCSFRMTDIWRSFVAQRCLWEMDSRVVFSRATVFQRRNEHSLLRDFKDEVPGYLGNAQIRTTLDELSLQGGRERSVVAENLLACYGALVAAGIFPADELALVEAWLADVAGAPV